MGTSVTPSSSLFSGGPGKRTAHVYKHKWDKAAKATFYYIWVPGYFYSYVVAECPCAQTVYCFTTLTPTMCVLQRA